MSASVEQVVEGSVAGQQQYGGTVFPAVLECRAADLTLEATCAWLGARRDELIAKTSACGALLFRGFPLHTAEDFDHFVAAFQLPNFAYADSLSNAVRVNRTPRVFTANEAPPEVAILFHHELAQTPVFPSKLFFFCEQPAAQGGATPLCRSDILWDRLVARCPQFAHDCQTKGLRYANVMPPADDYSSGMGRSWQSTLRAQTPTEAEARLRGFGYQWHWFEDGSLRAMTPVLQAVHELGDGRKSFFNQLIAAFCGWHDSRNDPARAITFGDSSALDRDAVLTAVSLAEDLAFDIPWQRGDVAFVDNYMVMHGRRTFAGTRKVLASLVAAE